MRGEDPRHTAVNNEHFRHYRDGMLRVLSIIDEEILKTEEQLKAMQ